MTDLNHHRDDREVPAAPDRAEAGAVVEQAKGVVMFCRGVDADRAAHDLLAWAQEWGVTVRAVAEALLDDVCQGTGAEPAGTDHRRLVRWLEQQLRQPVAPEDDITPEGYR